MPVNVKQYRYKLRTLLIVLALGPIVLAVGYWKVERYVRHQAARRRLDAAWDIGLQEYLRVSQELVDIGQTEFKVTLPTRIIFGEEGQVGAIEIPEP